MDNNNRNTEFMSTKTGGRLPGSKTDRKGNFWRAKGCNAQDPFWYAKDEAAIKLLGQVAFVNTVGDALPGAANDTTPGFICYPFRPAFPYSYHQPFGGPLSHTADSLLQDMGQVWSNFESVNFESPDAVMAITAAADLFAYLSEIKRAFGLRKTFELRNAYSARGFVEALGFDFDDMSRNSADFVASYNLLIDEINKVIHIPQPFFLGDRWDFLCSNVFVDNDAGEYATLFAPVHDARIYLDASHPSGTRLLWLEEDTSNPYPAKTLAWHLQNAYDMLESLKRADMRTIFANLKAAFTDFKRATPLDLDFTLSPVRNDVVSAAFHNASFVQHVAGFQFNITEERNPSLWDSSRNVMCFQKNGKLQALPYAGYTRPNVQYGENVRTFPAYIPNELIIDTFDLNPSPGNILDITAFMGCQFGLDKYGTQERTFVVTSIGGRDYLVAPWICRSEIFLAPRVYYLKPGDEEMTYDFFPCLFFTDPLYLDSPSSTSNWLARMSHVNSSPLIRLFDYQKSLVRQGVGYGDTDDPESDTFEPYPVNISLECDHYLGEIDAYTGISPAYLQRLNRQCFYNMLMLPKNTKSIAK